MLRAIQESPRRRRTQHPGERQLRMLAARCSGFGEDESCSSATGFVSCSSTAAQSAIVLNVAQRLAASCRDQVLLIDADPDRTVGIARFAKCTGPGLSEALLGDVELTDCCYQTDFPKLSVMPVARDELPPVAYEPQRVAQFCGSLRLKFQHILVDLPAAVADGAGLILAQQLDGVLLVVETGCTRLAAARQAKQLLSRAGVRIRGVVVTRHG